MVRRALCYCVLPLAFIAICACNTTNGPEDQELVVRSADPVVDYDGNSYATIQIGQQVWMAEHLRSTHYSDGTPVEHFAYENDATIAAVYGLLYRWSASTRNRGSSSANPSGIQGVCPANWHLPSDAEWQVLIDNLGGEAVAGGKLKESGTEHWLSPNSSATNESGFGALPSGWFDFTGEFYGLGEVVYFRTSAAPNAYEAFTRRIGSGSASIPRGGLHPDDAISIRCVKDQ